MSVRKGLRIPEPVCSPGTWDSKCPLTWWLESSVKPHVATLGRGSGTSRCSGNVRPAVYTQMHTGKPCLHANFTTPTWLPFICPVSPAHVRGRPAEKWAWRACGRSACPTERDRCAGCWSPHCPLSHCYSRPGRRDKRALLRGPGKDPAGRVWAHAPCGHTDRPLRAARDRREAWRGAGREFRCTG